MSNINTFNESLFPEYALKIESFDVSPALKWAGGKR